MSIALHVQLYIDMILALSVAKQQREFDVTTNLYLSGERDGQKRINHFRVAQCYLCLTLSLGAQPFIWK